MYQLTIESIKWATCLTLSVAVVDVLYENKKTNEYQSFSLSALIVATSNRFLLLPIYPHRPYD